MSQGPELRSANPLWRISGIADLWTSCEIDGTNAWAYEACQESGGPTGPPTDRSRCNPRDRRHRPIGVASRPSTPVIRSAPTDHGGLGMSWATGSGSRVHPSSLTGDGGRLGSSSAPVVSPNVLVSPPRVDVARIGDAEFDDSPRRLPLASRPPCRPETRRRPLVSRQLEHRRDASRIHRRPSSRAFSSAWNLRMGVVLLTLSSRGIGLAGADPFHENHLHELLRPLLQVPALYLSSKLLSTLAIVASSAAIRARRFVTQSRQTTLRRSARPRRRPVGPH